MTQPLILIRHGQAEHQVQPITGGWSDTVLTALGKAQVLRLAERLQENLDGRCLALVSSSLRRTRQTAAILGRQLKLELQVEPELIDLNNGEAAGKTHAEAQALALPRSEPAWDWQPYPRAESWRQFYQRTVRFIERFSARQTGPALLVTHGANIEVIVSWWLGLPVESNTHFDCDPASLTVLKINSFDERALERLNDTAHLYAQGLAGTIQLD